MGAIVYHTHTQKKPHLLPIFTQRKTYWANYDLLISICNQVDFTEELAPKWEGKYCVALVCMENTFHNYAKSTERI